MRKTYRSAPFSASSGLALSLACVQAGTVCYAKSEEPIKPIQQESHASSAPSLHEITWGDRFFWGLQLAFDPKELTKIVPMYAYSMDSIDDVTDKSSESSIQREILLSSFYVGSSTIPEQGGKVGICLYDHKEAPKGNNGQSKNCLHEIEAMGQSFDYLALNRPIYGMEADESYWFHADQASLSR